MKNYKEILAEITAVRAEIASAEEEAKNLRNERKAFVDEFFAENTTRLAAVKAAKLETKYQELGNRIVEAEQRAENFRVLVKVLNANAETSLYAETIPTVLEVVGKYAGKRVGEKTAQKIRNEIAEKTGVRFSYNWDYTTRWHLTIDELRTITIYFAVGCGMWDSEGKLNHITEDMLLKPTSDYVENPTEYIEEMNTAAEEIRAKLNALNKLIDRYNEKAVGEIEHFEHIYQH